MLPQLKALDELVSSLKDKDPMAALLVQPSPDPDCLGAAAAIAILLQERYGIKSKIFNKGEVSHPQNKSMVNLLHIKLNKAENFIPEKYQLSFVLDSDLTGTGFKNEEFSFADIRIDHHSMDRDAGSSIEDLRPVGSTCSIVWEWLKDANIKLEDFPEMATGLILGIKTDTQEFSSDNTSDLDFEAFKDLMHYVDRERLSKLMAYPLPASVFENESFALGRRVIKSSALVSNIGTLVPQKRDEIPIIADRFIRMDGISTTVVMGIIENELHVSVRSTNSSVNVASLCEEVFGEEHSGAKEGCGGAKIPLSPFVFVDGMMLPEESRKAMEDQLFEYYSEKVFLALGE